MSVGGHFEEVEDAADVSVQPSQGLGDRQRAGFDELDGEASQAGGVFGAVAGADAATVLVEGPVEAMVGGVFDAPVAAVQGQERLGISGIGGVRGQAIGGFDAGVAGGFVEPGAAQPEDLADAGEVEVVVEGGGGPDGALLDAAMREGGRFLELGCASALGGEVQGDIEQQIGLVVLGGEEVVGVTVEEVGGESALGQQRIGGEGLAGDVVELVEERDDGADLVGAFGLVVGAGLQPDFFWV